MLDAAFIHNPEGGPRHAHAATLVEPSPGELLAAWYAYPEVEHEGGTLMLAERRRGRREWACGARIFTRMERSLGNPVLFVDPCGLLHLLFVALSGQYWNDAVLHGAYSADGGRTWSESKRIWPAVGVMVRHPPIALADGSVLLPAYHEAERESVLLRSTAPFSSWDLHYRFDGHALIQPVLLREGPRRLALFFRPAGERRVIFRSHSADDGASWSSPISTGLPTALSGIAGFRLGATIGIVHNHTEAHQRHPLSLSLSHDGGVTWEVNHRGAS